MKLINQYIIKEHLYPFMMALIVLLFVLLTNFLLRSMDRFLGKGLDLILILEFIFLNLAWILALAVPMAVLIATLMAFGRLSADNEISAFRSLSISYFRIIFPPIIFSICITLLMIFFNNQILPEMNHKARMLSSDISRKRPDLDFDIGYFIDSIKNYTFLLGSRENETFKEIVIFANPVGKQKQTIIAESGTISSIDNGVVLRLINGVIHEYIGNSKNEYREIYFDRHHIMIPLENMLFDRRNSNIRGDREMTFSMMRNKIKSFENKISKTNNRITNRLVNESEKLNIQLDLDSSIIINPVIVDNILELFTDSTNNYIENSSVLFKRANRRINNLKRGIKSDFTLIKSYNNSINKYLVELHKKFSIPFASIVFVLIGAPLGIIARKSGFAVSTAFSIGFFIIYWSFLIGGEEFADRGLLSPFLSMWLPNFVLGLVGIVMCYWISKEKRIINLKNINIIKLKDRGAINDKII